MKKILIILTGVLLVYSEPVLANNEITGIAIARKISKSVKKTNKKSRKSVKKKATKKKAKKVIKKKVKKVKKTKVKSYRVRYNVGEIQSYAHSLVLSYGWSEEDYHALVHLWYRESGWSPNARNKKSGACGIPQALPCRKMASEGKDYLTNYKTQVRWGLKYIKARYGSPSGAWSHSQQKGWY